MQTKNLAEVQEKIFEASDKALVVDTDGIIKKTRIDGANVIYGVRRSLTSTSSEWLRTDGAENLVAQASIAGASYTNDFDAIYPWGAIKTVNYDVANDVVTAEIGDANFAFDGTNGEVMTYIPEFYYKRWQDASSEYIQIARYTFNGATKSNAFYIGRYTTSANIHSISGATPTVNQNITTFRNQAMSKGTKWQQLDWHFFVIQMLYLVEYADGNSQGKLGNGVTGASAKVNSGGCDSLLMTSGCITNDTKNSVIYRGIEDPFGNIFQFVDGINISNYQAYICYDYNQYVCDIFTDPYQAIGYVNGNSGGQINTMGYDSANSMVMLPKTVGTSTYGDNYWCSNGNKIVAVGGAWGNGAFDGVFFWSCDNASGYSYGFFGGRLLKTV